MSEARTEDYELNLQVKLTAEEVAKRADRMAHLYAQKDEKEEAKKAAAKQMQAQIDEIDAEIKRLANEVRDRACYRTVPCQRRYDFAAGEVTEQRLDTFETLSERTMTASERQLELEMGP